MIFIPEVYGSKRRILMLRISCVPIVLGDFGCDVTCQACWDNSQIRYRTFQASSGNLDSASWPGYCMRIWFAQIMLMHESIPAASSPPPSGWPPGISIFFALDGKFPGVGILELSNPPGWGRKKRANAPSSVNTATFFIVIMQSSSAILSILMCDFLFQLTSSFVIALGF